MSLLLVDVGGSRIKSALLEGEEIDEVRFEDVAERTPEAVIGQVCSLARKSAATELALALPGTVRPSGAWSNSAAYGLMGLQIDVRQALEEANAPPLRALAQDVLVAGRGAGLIYPELDRFGMLNLGTGLGGAVVVSGWPWSGLAQEVGHLRLMEMGRPCRCGSTDCLEASAGWGALRERYSHFPDAGSIVSAARNGNREAEAILREATEAVARAAAAIASVVSSQGIMIIGGVAEQFFGTEESWLELNRAFEGCCISAVTEQSPLLRGPGPQGPLIGIASLAGRRVSLG